MIKVLFFARVRDQAGRAELELPLPDGVQDLGQLMAVLSQRDEKLQQALSDPRLLMALNQEMPNLWNSCVRILLLNKVLLPFS